MPQERPGKYGRGATCFHLGKTGHIRSRDLVDVSAEGIVGAYTGTLKIIEMLLKDREDLVPKSGRLDASRSGQRGSGSAKGLS
jgi:hypothetical protein